MAAKTNAPATPVGPVPYADVDTETEPGLVSSVPEQLPEEEQHADLPSASMVNGQFILRCYEGVWVQEWDVAAAIALQRRLQPRRDDVIVTSLPKCGTTWLNALAFATMARRAYPAVGADHPLLRLNSHQCIPFLDNLFRGRTEAKLEALPSPRLMNTHMPLGMIMPGAGGCKVVYVCREPKDMVVSMWHFLRRLQPDLTLADVLDSVCSGVVPYGPFWDHILGYWRASLERPDAVLFLRYEELLRDPAGNVREIGRFVGLPFSDEEEDAGVVEDIVKLCSFAHLQPLDANSKGQLDPLIPIPREALFRKGVAGDWANHMTPEMARRVDEVVADKIHLAGLTFL